MRSMKYGASWKSSEAKGSGVAVEVISPGSNIRGLVVHRATYSALGNFSSLLVAALVAKGGVPSGVTDGDVIASTEDAYYISASSFGGFSLNSPVYIESGKGLYMVCSGEESVVMKSVLYSLL